MNNEQMKAFLKKEGLHINDSNQLNDLAKVYGYVWDTNSLTWTKFKR